MNALILAQQQPDTGPMKWILTAVVVGGILLSIGIMIVWHFQRKHEMERQELDDSIDPADFDETRLK